MARQLWLLRHAEAEPHGSREDSQRRLTERGEGQAQDGRPRARAARAGFEAILFSPKVRARQTAELAAEALGGGRRAHGWPCSRGAGAAASTPRQALDAMADLGADGRLLLVGHEPDLSGVVAELTGGRIDLKKGGLAVRAPRGRRRRARCPAAAPRACPDRRAPRWQPGGPSRPGVRRGRRSGRRPRAIRRRSGSRSRSGCGCSATRRGLLELLAQLAHEHVDRAVAADHRVAPQPRVDLLALEHAALGRGEQLDQLELAAGEVDAVLADEGLEAVGADLDLAGAARGATSARPLLRRRRRTTLCTRAMTSSGWQGLVIQSSAPRRSPRTRWATVEGPVQTTMPSSGSASQRRSSQVQAWGRARRGRRPGRSGASTTTASAGTGLASTRCSQPSRSRRLQRTWMKPLSRSRTAIRRDPRRRRRLGGW